MESPGARRESHADQLPEELLRRILRSVANETGKSGYALVCRRWHALSASCQEVVVASDGALVDSNSRWAVVKRKGLTEAQLLRIRRFRHVTTLRLSLSSNVDPAFVLGGVSCFTELQDLSLSLSYLIDSDRTLGALAHAFPQLRQLALSCAEGAFLAPSALTLLVQLERLTLSGVDELPQDFGSLTSLRSLSLTSRGPSLFELPKSFTGLSNLQELHMHCPFKELPEDLGNLKSLVHLRIWCTRSSTLARLPRSVTSLPILETVSLRSEILEEIPDPLEHLQSLRALKVFHCKQLRELPDSVVRLTKLTALHSPLLQEQQMGLLASATALVDLRLHKVEGRIPDEFCHRLKHLEKLHMSDYSFSLPPDFGRLLSLRQLMLDKCSEVEELPASFLSLTQLTALFLRGLSRLKALPRQIDRLSSLRSLAVSCCPRLLGLPPSLASLRELRAVALEHLPLVSFLPEAFRSWLPNKLSVCFCPGIQRQLPEPFHLAQIIFPGDMVDGDDAE